MVVSFLASTARPSGRRQRLRLRGWWLPLQHGRLRDVRSVQRADRRRAGEPDVVRAQARVRGLTAAAHRADRRLAELHDLDLGGWAGEIERRAGVHGLEELVLAGRPLALRRAIV